jgi:hypothetical protein
MEETVTSALIGALLGVLVSAVLAGAGVNAAAELRERIKRCEPERNLRLRLPRAGPIEVRLARIVEVHDHLRRICSDYLDSDMGRHLVVRFGASYPDRHATRVKMLDLVL